MNMEKREIVLLKKPTVKLFKRYYNIDRIYKYVKACVVSKWNYTKQYHFLCAYFDEKDRISIKILSGNGKIKLNDNYQMIMDISFIREMQEEYRTTNVLNEVKLKYLLSDENI